MGILLEDKGFLVLVINISLCCQCVFCRLDRSLNSHDTGKGQVGSKAWARNINKSSTGKKMFWKVEKLILESSISGTQSESYREKEGE